MTLHTDTVDRVRAFWRSWAEQPDDPDAVSVVLIGAERFVRASEPRRGRVVAASVDDLAALVDVLGNDVERAVEARLAYCDDASRLVATDGVIGIADGDVRIVALEAASEPVEWREASVDEPCEHRFGVVEHDALSAVATLQLWADAIGHIGVFTSAPARRAGLASKVASAAVERARALSVVPQWRSRVGNDASERVADSLGFVPLGRQLFVRMKARA